MPTTRGPRYSLFNLLLFMLIPALLAAVWAPIVRTIVQRQAVEQMLIAMCVGGACGMIVGTVLGAGRFRRRRGIAWSLVICFVAGALVGPFVLLEPSMGRHVVLASVTAATLIVLLGLFSRMRAFRITIQQLEEEVAAPTDD